jgi:hypothetical protein
MSFCQTAFAAAALSLAALVSTGSARAADLPVTASDLLLKAKAPPPDLPFFLLIDDRVTFAYMPTATFAGDYSRNPDGSIDGKTAKQVYAFTHFDVWAYGTNFFNISMYKMDHNVPANPCTNAGVIYSTPATCAGATQVWGILRSTYGWNEIFNTKAFSAGPLHNISFEIGGEASASDDFNAQAKRAYVAGLQFAFDLPYKGFFNVAPMAYKETNHSAWFQCGLFGPGVPGVSCIADGNTDFNTTWTVETNYYMDLGFLPENMRFWSISGRASWIGPKGNQAAPLTTGAATVINLDSEPIRLTFDAGKAIWGPKLSHFVDVWVAYRYVQNKSGYDHATSSLCVVNGVSNNTCTESTLYTGVTVKF